MITRRGDGRKLLAGFAKIEADLNRRHQRLIRTMLTDLVMHSPQWSGNLATQWQVVKASGKGTYRPIMKAADKGSFRARIAYAMGDDPAVATTLLRESEKIDRITYKDKVKFVNKTPYAKEVEDAMETESGQMASGGKLRLENLIPYFGGVGMIGYIDMKYRANGGAKGVLKYGGN